MKNKPKKERFWERKTCQNHGRVIKIKVFRFLKKVGKLIEKGLPKSIKFGPKWSHGRGRVDCVGVPGRFWRDRKKCDFSIGKKSTKNHLKSILGASRGRARHIDARVRQVKVPGAAANYQRNRLNRLKTTSERVV